LRRGGLLRGLLGLGLLELLPGLGGGLGHS
jgi:hypothetical protein